MATRTFRIVLSVEAPTADDAHEIAQNIALLVASESQQVFSEADTDTPFAVSVVVSDAEDTTA